MAIAYHTHQFEIPTASNAETSAGLVSDKVVVPSGLVSVLANYVTSTALTTTLAGYVQSSAIGVTVQAYDADLAAIAALASAADKVPYATGAGAWALADFTVSGRALVAAATVAAQRTALGLGTAATTDATAYATAAQGARADTAIQPGSTRLVPAGGTTGQVLAKTSGTDYATGWSNAGAGDLIAASVFPATRAELKALNTSKDRVAFLKEAGREGQFLWNGTNLSATLTPQSITSTLVDATTDTITSAAHALQTGHAVFPTTTVNGVTVDVIYYAIRVTVDTFKLATTYANAIAGTAVDLTGTTNFTVRRYIDPEEGIYVVPTGKARDGSQGAWVRAYTGLAVFDWFGAVGDGVADDTLAMNAAWAASKSLTGVSGKVYRFTGPVGSTSDFTGRELLGERSMTLLWSGAGASLRFFGEGWKLENWNINADGVVNEGISMGTAGDNRGSSVSGNIFFSAANSYFSTFLTTTNWWYSRFCNNVMYNSESNEVRRGNCITGNYSVNNDISGNYILRFDSAIAWSNVPRPGAGHVCEGWMISQNTLAANNTHFLALAGLLPTLNANIIDISSSSANPIISDADCTVITSNWIDCPAPVLLRNSARHIVANNVFVGSANQHLAFQGVGVAQVSGNSFAFGNQAISADAGCSGLSVVGNSFSAFTVRAADISLAGNSIWQHNILSNGTAEPLLGGNFDPQYRQYHATTVRTFGSGTTEVLDFAIPSGIFSAKPSVVNVQVNGWPTIVSNYDYDNAANTATNVRVTFIRFDSGNMPGGAVRVQISAYQ